MQIVFLKDIKFLAQYDVEVNTARADAEKAFELQAATIQQRLKEQTTQVQVVERTKQIEIREQEMARKEKALEATIKKPAESEKFRLEKIAEAERKQTILKAEADAEAKAKADKHKEVKQTALNIWANGGIYGYNPGTPLLAILGSRPDPKITQKLTFSAHRASQSEVFSNFLSISVHNLNHVLSEIGSKYQTL